MVRDQAARLYEYFLLLTPVCARQVLHRHLLRRRKDQVVRDRLPIYIIYLLLLATLCARQVLHRHLLRRRKDQVVREQMTKKRDFVMFCRLAPVQARASLSSRSPCFLLVPTRGFVPCCRLAPVNARAYWSPL